jgi:hypothetical protein
MYPFYRRSVKGRLQTGEFLMNGHAAPTLLRGDVTRDVASDVRQDWEAELLGALVCCLKTRNLAGEQGVSREFVLQSGEQLQSPRFVLLAHKGNRQQDSRKGR